VHVVVEAATRGVAAVAEFLRKRLPVGGGCVYVLQMFFFVFFVFFRPSKI